MTRSRFGVRRTLVWLAGLAAALGIVLFAPAALAEPVRILIAVGNNQGLPAERPLKFADADARRVRDVMVSLGGVRPEHAYLLNEPARADFFAAIERAKAEARRHRAEEVTLFFYFSGHGDREALHFGPDRVLLSELSLKLREVPAALRIAVTDACRATREKGFVADEPFAISATMIPQASGQVWIHASSDGEAAQESDELQGAIFTQAWLSGLRGAADVNGDSRVTLDESFTFAHSQTLIRSSKSSGVLQKPEAVVSLRESAPVVLTQTAARMGTIGLPSGRDTHFLVYSAGAKSVLSELWSAPDRRLLLRVPPGRYVVHKRAGGLGGVAQIAVAENEVRTLEERDFRTSALVAVASKGGDADGGEPRAQDSTSPEHEPSLGWDTGVSTRTGFVHGPRLGWGLGWKHVAIIVGGAADFGARAFDTKDEKLTNVYGRAGLELRLPIGSHVVLRGGAGGRAGAVIQTLVPTGGASTATTAKEETKRAFMAGPEVVLGARWMASPRWFADLSATGAVPFLREEETLRGVPVLTGSLALGARL